MGTHITESSRLLMDYTSYNGKAESPATLAESADGCFRDDEKDGSGSMESEGRVDKGLSVGLASVFLLAEMAGAGVLNVPKAVANAGWAGLPLMVLMCLAVGFAGTRLGMCWVLLEERWPEYRMPCRRPYPAIARRALGKAGQIVAEVSMEVTLFGAATVYLLVSSQMINDLLGSLVPSLSQCSWTLILGVLLCPTTWLSTPKDFWGAPLFAMSATLLACLVVVVEVVLEKGNHASPEYLAPTFSSFFLSFSSILFALGGASIFPTIQNDMKNRAQFPESVVMTFLSLLGIYLPLCTICYGILGTNSTPENILAAVSGPAVTVVKILLVCHFLFAFSIVINPINQATEMHLNVATDTLSVRRVVVRSCVLALVVLVGFTIPDFSKILDLIGGSTVALMSFVLPPVCYLRLCAVSGLDGLPLRVVPKWEVVALWAVAVVGVVGGVGSTWSALSAIITEESFTTTCFSPQTFL
ncbi:amino acid transporter AVT1J-like [Portunus trituberculatus]|uniref:amino acid transporter AVT1J-like n=1 Tax=Portunus trituberculatus TaxID=210409 RepID=UPI001E1D1437|nr:amino acid transporter AVT1J-like [Portunus trituberculatus]XP_045138353.1 amino acid transporter AVT1J-like [Portunus trituberculatus]XP_045138354.1 amino acid transporter AVT1J-like [Portunus trituberculatus]